MLFLRRTVLVKCDKKSYVESHRKSKLHQAILVTTSTSRGKQTYIQPVADPENFGGGDLKPKPQKFECLHQN